MAVGVDIGCGMCAVPIPGGRLNFASKFRLLTDKSMGKIAGLHKHDLSVKKLEQMQQLVKEWIPTGAV